MKNYIALLRGINISGKNKVSMPLLKSAFEDIGFLNVKTYINSGNILFASESINQDELTCQCKSMITQRFDLDVPVVVISQKELQEALAHTPLWWDQPSEEEIIHQAIFLIPPVTIEEVYKAVGEAKLDYEQVAFYKNIIFWSAPRATLSRTRWYKIASSTLNYKVTIRNANTIKKLLALFDK